MSLGDMAQRVVQGDVEGVKRDILKETLEQAAKPREEPRAAPCDKAPAGYKCAGLHDEKGRCVTLEVIP